MNELKVMESQLVKHLQQVRDRRSRQGQRYPLWLLLLLSILGVMSGAQGYQALEDFGVRHYAELCQYLGVSLARMPSDTTLRRMFRHVDFAQLVDKFNTWATQTDSPLPQEWFGVDGKSIRGTVQDGWESYQNFVAVVSVYSHQRRIVLGQQPYQNKQQSEITVVQQLLAQLDITGGVFTMDALHAQKNA
jgi:hypothetical protein